MNNRPTPPRLISRGVRLQGNFRHIALWLGVIGLIPLSYFLKQDMGWSSKNTWRIVVLPLSICIVWSLAAIGWARHGRIQIESSAALCGTELSAERPRPERRAVLPTILVALLTLGCIALLFIVAVFLAFAESAEC
jgi:hypothetical protein